jgi:hypothetical protein
MDAGTVTTLDLAPERVQNLIRYAVELGMVVELDERGNRYCWSVKSSQVLDCDRIWVFWDGPGPNGGRTGIKLYRPFARRQPSRVTNRTFREAWSWMRILSGKVLDR